MSDTLLKPQGGTLPREVGWETAKTDTQPKPAVGSLGLLKHDAIEHKHAASLNSIRAPNKDEFILLESVVDSGAARSVCPRNFGAQFGLIETPGSRDGDAFRTATGDRVRNEGGGSYPGKLIRVGRFG